MSRLDSRKVLELIDLYGSMLDSRGIEPIAYDLDAGSPEASEALSHCRWMLERMELMARGNETHKLDRWLGFIQGVMWMCGHYTVNELREHVISCRE